MKNCFPCEISFALGHAFCSRTLILQTAELLSKMQIVFVLFILTVMPRSLNYHTIEISRFYSNCFKESYIWESKRYLGRTQTNKEERRIMKEAWRFDSGISSFDIITIVCDVRAFSLLRVQGSLHLCEDYTLDKFAEKHQPWMFPKMFSRCCESIIMEITYKCMYAWLVGATRTDPGYVVA